MIASDDCKLFLAGAVVFGYLSGLSGELIFDVDFIGGHFFDVALEGEIVFFEDVLISKEVVFMIQ